MSKQKITINNLTINLVGSVISGKNWRKKLEKRRSVLRSQFDASQYERPDLTWYHTAFLEYFLFLYDTSIYDRENNRYQIEKLFNDAEEEFGGYDIIILWHAFPRIGVDERNQFDFYRDMPGGLEGLRDLVKQIHAKGTYVFINYNPWDVGTRREPESDVEALAEIVSALDADGIFLDTMDAANLQLREAMDKIKPGIVFEAELTPSVRSGEICTGSWGQGSIPLPGNVLTLKWIEPRFSMRGVDRNSANRSPLIALGFFHGMGHVLWENIFGWWNPFSLEDRTMLRRCIRLLRAHRDAFLDPNWQPCVDTLRPVEVAAHRWDAGEKTVYTLFNSSGRSIDGPVIKLPIKDDMEIYDAWNGGKAQTTPDSDGQVIVHLHIDPMSCGCLVIQPKGWPPPISADIASLADKSSYYRVRPEAHLPRPVKPSEPAKPNEIPNGMVLIPGGKFVMKVDTIFGAPPGARYTHPQYSYASNHGHLTQELNMKSFLIDRTEVTNAQYKEFLNATGYKPKVMKNFLKHWIKPEGENSDPRLWQIPPGKENHPVVYVDLDDARAYARWAKKRLPTEEEWQYAAQGTDGRKWPWGDKYDPKRCNGPDGTMENDESIKSSFGGTTPVDAYPDGASPFGCLDMSGNVWEWTESERDDGHTRYAILRGGCYFRARGSIWYMPGGAQPCNRHAKMLLLYPGLDRCSTIGFRCVKDVEE